ncbi:hypothetical protein BGZ65_005887 [Modicella reniformis]|uniref:RNI-like protein n=1 Tax=Modicella reniformis TaxID=1440133 RepID=A0A9P6IWV3_9FUNG|nr:hypothetical protein BGZ65_005887 [Modicella reniformis]
MDNLRSLCNAVTKANVIHLTVDGTDFKTPALDVVNRSRRYDPILQLASNSRVQSLHLKGFYDFFSRISKSSLVPAPSFRAFCIDSEVSNTQKGQKVFDDFLENCSSLTTLKLKLNNEHSIQATTAKIFKKLPRLESLKIDCGKLSVTASFSHGTIQDMVITIIRIGDLNSDDLEFIQRNRFTRLAIEHTPRETDEEYFTAILSHSPELNLLQIGCQEPITDGDPIVEFVRQYGWSIVFLDAPWIFHDSFAAILDDITGKRDSQLEELNVHLQMLTADGINNLNNIIGQSKGLSVLRLFLVELQDENQVEKVLSLLTRHGRLLFALALYGRSLEQWLPHFALSFPTRQSFPKLESFALGSYSEYDVPPSCIPWITAMISIPPLLPASPQDTSLSLSKSSPPAQSPAQDVLAESQSDIEPETIRQWSSLKRLHLLNLSFQSKDWRTVIKAMDFSKLEVLDIENTNFSHEQLKSLVAYIPDQSFSESTMEYINLTDTNLTKNRGTRALLAGLQKRVPLLRIEGV